MAFNGLAGTPGYFFVGRYTAGRALGGAVNGGAQPGSSRIHVATIANGGVCPAGLDTTVLTTDGTFNIMAPDDGFYTLIGITNLYVTFGASLPTTITVTFHTGVSGLDAVDQHTLGPSFYVASTTSPCSLIFDVPPLGWPTPTGATPASGYWLPRNGGGSPFISINPTGQAVTVRANSACLAVLMRLFD